jgi:diguanylate cyclase (GGDEF)-like protein
MWYGLLGALASFGLAFSTYLITKADPVHPHIYMLAAALGGFCLLSSWLAYRRRLAWAARLLAVAFVTIPSIMVFAHELPHEVALSTYIGAILATTIGATYFDTIAGTALIVVLGLLAIQPGDSVEATVAARASVVALLLSAGITLSWMQAGIQRGVRSLEASQIHFHRLSHIDSLTGLGNRRQFDLSLGETLARASESLPAAVILLDMDNLKQINDLYTHPVGDKALRILADVIRSSTRGSDIACRIGGDEFAIILPIGGLRGAKRIAGRITKRLQSAKLDEGPNVRISVSIGMAMTKGGEVGIEQLMAEADANMYASRRSARRSPKRSDS